jgi:hypothetical protein
MAWAEEDDEGVGWKPVTTGKFIGACVTLSILLLLAFRSEKGFIPVIDHANLAFHEAGHLIFGLLGATLGLYGGTLGQLVFPVAAAFSFWRRQEPVSTVLCGTWFFENFLNIARYMADARAQVLPLVGGGGHDWAAILGRWGLLRWDTTLAGFVSVAGWLGMISLWGWMTWRWWEERQG